MQISVNLILYYISDLKPEIRSGLDLSGEISAIRLWNPPANSEQKMESVLSSEHEQIPERAKIRERDPIGNRDRTQSPAYTLFLCSRQDAPDDKELFQKNWFLLVDQSRLYEVMNLVFDIYHHLSEWDKSMHIAALEGKPLQTLLDLSEPVLKHPMIAFDSCFDVIAYTKDAGSDYRAFQETIEKGYTNRQIMEKLQEKHIFSRIKHDELLVAPAADAPGQNNIYMQFIFGDSILGYCSLFGSGQEPEAGFMDLVHIFMENLSLCFQRDFHDQMSGQMMSDSFLSQLIGDPEMDEQELADKVQRIPWLSADGVFRLAVLEFVRQEPVPLTFLVRMLARQFTGYKVFLQENTICMLKTFSGDRENFLNETEKKQLKGLLENYKYVMGISNSFKKLRQLKSAFIQARAALFFGKKLHPKGKAFFYRDYSYFQMFRIMEKEMDLTLLQSQLYLRLRESDLADHTEYVKFVITYLRNDCSAVHTSEELGIHRNTVRNTLQLLEKKFRADFSEVREKEDFVLSDRVQQYLELKVL